MKLLIDECLPRPLKESTVPPGLFNLRLLPGASLRAGLRYNRRSAAERHTISTIPRLQTPSVLMFHPAALLLAAPEARL